jgi:hypothetical protein
LHVAFIRVEIEQSKSRLGIAGHGDAISGREAFQKRAGGVEVNVLQEVDRRARFDNEKNLCGIIHGSEVRDGLLRAIIEDAEVFAMQAFNEFATGVGDDDADVDALDGEADGLRRGGRRILRGERKGEEQKEREKEAEALDWGAGRFVFMISAKGKSEF